MAALHPISLLSRAINVPLCSLRSSTANSRILYRAARSISTTCTLNVPENGLPPISEPVDFVSPQVDPRFRYGDVLVIKDIKGERKLVGPLKKGGFRDGNNGRLNHDDFIGLPPLSSVQTHKGGSNYTLHWPTLDEYCTSVKRQANIMYPKDATTAVHLLDLFPGAHVLEAGTGNGSMTLYIQRAIQGPGSHLDTVDIRNEHSLQAELNVSRFWRGMYRTGVTFWRSSGGLETMIKHFKGEAIPEKDPEDIDHFDKNGRALTRFEILRKKLMDSKEVLAPNPHPPGHQYDAINLDLPDCKKVLLDLMPLLKPDRPMCLYMVNMSQVLELAQWLRRQEDKHTYSIERVVEVEWKDWTVRSAAVRSRVKGRVHVGGSGDVSRWQGSTSSDNNEKEDAFTSASDNIPDDALGWVCRPVHMPKGHTGFLVQIIKNSS